MRRGTTRALAAVLTCGFALAGCSGGSDGDPQGAGTSASPSAAAELATTAEVTKVTGRLDAAGREALVTSVTAVVDRWMDGAYLGDFPRNDYAQAFAGFTSGAAAKAERNLGLMANADISDRITNAEATRRSLSLDVLSVKQKPVGVTATVDLAFTTTGALTGAQEVTGTLNLTPDGEAWKVFGFEISRTSTP